MTGTLNDVRALLLKTDEHRSSGTGLGKNEIHPVAHRLKRETDELFQQATFRVGYRGVRSQEIRRVLSLFEYGTDYEVKDEEEADVEHSDEYYFLEKDEDIEAGRERLQGLSDETHETLEEVLQSLTEDRMQLIREENERMDEKAQASV